eukprot:TRINITY_DN23628_c0_g1_i2.p1 TRINITY_DN23628_c0_g1~~TRINITY_DN23628_c0_g1_i2.p1  ORF type:complete len:199 (+),score=25.56 TRINITY_DN23628_c0_g1_i2:31-597(+)
MQPHHYDHEPCVQPAHAAGMSVLRDTTRVREMRKGMNTNGLVSNDSHQTLRTLAAHSLLGTREQMLLRGSARSHDLRSSQVALASNFPGFMQRSLSESAMRRWQEDPPSSTQLSPAEVVASGDVRLRWALPAAGVKSEVAHEKKVCNFSAVRYNFVAEQATPVAPHERTSFMSLAHRDPTAPGVWLPQ